MSTKIRADQIGSFLRPADILEARQSGDDGSARLHELEDRAILRVLDKQRELGLDVLSDGEFRRNGFMGDLTAAVDGFDYGEHIPRAWKSGSVVAPPLCVPALCWTMIAMPMWAEV